MNEKQDKRWRFTPTAADERQRSDIAKYHKETFDIEFSQDEFVAKMVRSGMRRQLARIDRARKRFSTSA